MDAGLIAGTQMNEMPTATKPARVQGNGAPGQQSGPDAVDGSGEQGSFADVLKQNSQPLPEGATAQAHPGALAMHLLGSRLGDASTDPSVTASRIAALESDAVKPPADTVKLPGNTAADLNTKASADGGVKGKPGTGDAAIAAGEGTSVQGSGKKAHSHTQHSGAGQAEATSQQQVLPIESTGMNAPVLVTNPQIVDPKTTTPALSTTGSQGLQGGQPAMSKLQGQGGKVLRGESGLRGSASAKDEQALLEGATASAGGDVSIAAGSTLLPSFTEHVASQGTAAESSELAVSPLAMGVVPLAPALHPVGNTTTEASISPLGGHSAPGQADASSSTATEHATLVSTPNVLEVGLSSGTHGWVRVRAELSAGGDVSASMKTTSEAAFDSLHKELPSISAYLATERVGVSSLVVEHSAGLAGSGAGLAGSGMSNPEGGRQGPESDGRQGQPTTRGAWESMSPESRDADAVLANLALPAATLATANYPGGSGGWLSVLA